MTKQRSLVAVIDAITAIAPDLAPVLARTRTSALYAAPESAYLFWNETADALQRHAGDHPKAVEIAAIFAGKAGPQA